jgi:hypothetical protein
VKSIDPGVAGIAIAHLTETWQKRANSASETGNGSFGGSAQKCFEFAGNYEAVFGLVASATDTVGLAAAAFYRARRLLMV